VPADPTHDPVDDARARSGLDALRQAANRPERWTPQWPGSWRAVLEARAGGPAVIWIAAIVAALALGVGAFAVAHHGGGASPPVTADLPMAVGADTTLPASSAGAGSDDAPELVVQVAGAVRHPGVFHLPAGSRLGDLVTRAGGLTPDADVDRIDLAAPLTDGALVYLPRRGQALPPGPVIGGGDSSSNAAGAGSGSSTSLMVDLNTATAEELDALPGVGPTTAAAIVSYRAQHGAFRSIDDLADVTGIGPAKLAQIRPHVHL
jgi:competence protein ComEA